MKQKMISNQIFLYELSLLVTIFQMMHYEKTPSFVIVKYKHDNVITNFSKSTKMNFLSKKRKTFLFKKQDINLTRQKCSLTIMYLFFTIFYHFAVFTIITSYFFSFFVQYHV